MSDLSHERLLQLLEYDELTGVFIRKVRTSASTKKGERAGSIMVMDIYASWLMERDISFIA